MPAAQPQLDSSPSGSKEPESAGWQVRRLACGLAQQLSIAGAARAGEPPALFFRRLHDLLARHPDWQVIRQRVFGPGVGPSLPPINGFDRFAESYWPGTPGAAAGPGDARLAVQLEAVAGVAVRPVRLGGRTVGAVFETDVARFCVLGGVRPASITGPVGGQATELFANLEAALHDAQMTFADVLRTWFWLRDIHDWYGEFNRARNEFFRRLGLTGKVPASTAVGSRATGGPALVGELLALQPRHAAARIMAVPSPRQGPAVDYGSSFSRAVEVSWPGQRRLYVSGTASILPDGRTAHPGDADAQVNLTMEVVESILQSRGLSWAEVTRATGYFKHGEHQSCLARWVERRQLATLPAVLVNNDLCRSELLFEFECDAVRCE